MHVCFVCTSDGRLPLRRNQLVHPYAHELRKLIQPHIRIGAFFHEILETSWNVSNFHQSGRWRHFVLLSVLPEV